MRPSMQSSPRPEGQDDPAGAEPCPVCGGAVIDVKCKRICSRCRGLVENCSGD